MLLSHLKSYSYRFTRAYGKTSTKRISLISSMHFTCSSERKKRTSIVSCVNNLPKNDVQLLLQPYYYTISIPNESIRSPLVRAYNYWTNLPNDIIEIMDEIFVMYYEGILLSDDLHDESEFRRGYPTAYKIFGVSRAEMTGRACLFIIAKKLLEINKEVIAAEVFVDSVFTLSAGSYKEVHYRENMICPTMEEYRQMTIDRAPPILGLPMKLLQTIAGHKSDFTKLVDLIGLHLQYLTDVSNLSHHKTWHQKGFCDDISEGCYTVPIIHAIKSGTLEGDIVSNIIKKRPKDVPTKKYCLSLLEKLGSIDYAKKLTISIEKELREEINRLGGNPLLVECIDQVNSWRSDEIFPTNIEQPEFVNFDMSLDKSNTKISHSVEA